MTEAVALPTYGFRTLSENRWARFTVRRTGRLLVSLWVLVTAAFLMIHVIPGDPIRAALGRVRIGSILRTRLFRVEARLRIATLSAHSLTRVRIWNREVPLGKHDVLRWRGKRDAIGRLEGQKWGTFTHDGRTIGLPGREIESHDVGRGTTVFVDGVEETTPIGERRARGDLGGRHGSSWLLERERQ